MASNAELAREGFAAQGFRCAPTPTLDVDERLHTLWPTLLKEEVDELGAAIGFRDLVAVADALADILYVAYEAAASYGIPIDAVFAEVHRSNLSKVPVDGHVEYRSDGKVLKPATFSPPQLAPILDAAARRGR